MIALFVLVGMGEKLEIETTPVTIFVGPNNSGKSKILTEIQEFCKNGNISRTFKLIDEINFFPIEDKYLEDEINFQLIRFYTKSRL